MRPGTVILGFVLLSVSAKAQRAYLGMDRNDYPGDASMAALRRTFAFTGYWLNNPPGEHRNSWEGKRKAIAAMGYGFLLLFTGREYAQLKASGDAAGVGNRDAGLAVQSARREGFRPGAVIFLDQEQGGRMLPEQRAYIHAWADGVARAGYRAGIYCSGIPFRESGAASVITADDIREHAGGRDIHFFVSNDQCGPSTGCVFAQSPPDPSRSGVSFADVWQFAQSPRRPAMTAACRQSYAADGNCYPPGVATGSGLHVDLDAANSADPSGARIR
ncbi:MAG TPA: glycoside hydrolase domain-containing protein [Candidatus Binatia bacterium]|nr:glycoside hydrolase domain-containing protein [Candidatus Binatia bacterium]